MFKELAEFAVKPELYTPGTKSIWDDEHISKGMLEAHLNPIWDAASRNFDFICKSVDWINEIAPPEQYTRLLDLGCGPGIYAECFSSSGYSVTGIDFSIRSINYAKEQSAASKSKIEYYYMNYLDIDYKECFDVITLIYCDYAALSINDRFKLLEKVHQGLKPGGKFIFDVFTQSSRDEKKHSWEYCENGGFFCEKPHVHMEAVYQYDDEDNTELYQHIIISEDGVDCYNVYDHFFSRETLVKELQNTGFADCEFYGDVSGSVYSDTGETICVVLIK